MGAKFHSLGRAFIQYSPLGISIVSLLLSGAALFNTIYEQDRDSGHKELLIQPQLTFVVGQTSSEKTYVSSLSIRNDGLGPAIIQEVTFESDNRCETSSTYKTMPSWNDFYQSTVIPRLEKVLMEDINFQISKYSPRNSSADYLTKSVRETAREIQSRSKPKDASNSKGYTDYSLYGVDTTQYSTFSGNTLYPGAIISAGSVLTVAEMKGELVESKIELKRKSDGLATVGREPEPVPATTRPLDTVGIGVGYCSFSGRFCDFVWQGDPKCFEGATASR